jgi:transposase
MHFGHPREVPTSYLFWQTDAQMERLKPFFPLSHGVPRVDDRRLLSGIIFLNRNGLRQRPTIRRRLSTTNGTAGAG